MATVNFMYICCIFIATNAAPVPVHMVDLTYVFDETVLTFPGMRKFETNVTNKGPVDGRYWLYQEDYFSGTHVGTHMDSPGHFDPNGITIDQIPISKFFGPAAVIDITRKAELDPDAEIELEDLLAWERQTGKTLDGHIVMLRSGWGKRWGNRTAFLGTSTDDETQMHSPGLSPRAAEWLVKNRDINGYGTDAISLDKGQGSLDDFPTHKILLSGGVYGIENVANLEQIPISGATLTVLPMKIGKGSGAPTRIIATFPVTSSQQSFFYTRGRHPYLRESAFGNPYLNRFNLRTKK